MADFENSKQLLNYDGDCIVIKGTDSINDFLENRNSYNVLQEFYNQLEVIERKMRDDEPQQYNKLLPVFKGVYDNLARLSDRCGDRLSKTGKEDTIKIDAELRWQLRVLLASSLSLDANPKTEQDCQANVKKALSAIPALKELYPIIEFFDYQVYFITAAKLMYELDLIVNPRIYFNNSSFVSDSLIIMDESDKDYEEMRNHIRKADLETKPKDLFTMLDTLSRCLQCAQQRLHRFWDEDFRQKLMDFIEETNSDINQIYEEYHLARMKNIYYQPNGEIKRPFIFKSPVSGFVLPQQVKDIYLSTDQDHQCLRLTIDYKSNREETGYKAAIESVSDDMEGSVSGCRKDQTIQLKALARRVISCIRNAAFKLASFSQEYYDSRFKEAQRLRVAGKEVTFPDLMVARTEIMSCFEIEKGTTEQLYRYILHVMGAKLNARIVPKIPGDDSFYNLGAYQIIARQRYSDSTLFYTIDWDEISLTPEKCLYNLIRCQRNTIILLSATGRLPVCSSNFCLEYLKNILKEDYHELPTDWIQKFDAVSAGLLPTADERTIHCGVLPVLKVLSSQRISSFASIRDQFKVLFPRPSWQRVEHLLADLYDELTSKIGDNTMFYMNRYYHFCFILYKLLHTEGCYSGIYFCNNLPSTESCYWRIRTLEQLATAMVPNASNDNPLIILNSNDFEGKMATFREEIGKGFKRLLLTSYNTTSIGMNLVHEAPLLQQTVGKLPDYWANNPQKKREKDIDLIACQNPTNYRAFRKGRPLVNDEDLDEKESTAIFFLHALHYTGRISNGTLFNELQSILSKHASLFDNNYEAFHKDLNCYKLKILKQAVGRICRRSIKGNHTFIYVEEDSVEAIRTAPMNHSYGVEFKRLIEAMSQRDDMNKIDNIEKGEDLQPVNNNYAATPVESTAESIRFAEMIARANEAQAYFSSLLRAALKSYDVNNSNFTIDLSDKQAQRSLEKLKKYIIKHPTISRRKETRKTLKYYFDLGSCSNGYSYELGGSKTKGIKGILPVMCSSGGYEWIDEKAVLLPQLMRSPIVYAYFEKCRFATTWKKGHFFLPPQLLKNVYQAKIGEEALRAVLYHLFPDDQFLSSFGPMYELADMYAEKRAIAFDAKNYNPKEYPESLKDLMPNLRHKVRKMHRKLVVVRILGDGSKPTQEIESRIVIVDGLIHAETGELIYSSLEHLRHAYESARLV